MKSYVLVREVNRYQGAKHYEFSGTVPELVEEFRYTLEKGKAYEGQRGCKKVNLCPKGIKALIKALETAEDNATCDGYSGVRYFVKD